MPGSPRARFAVDTPPSPHPRQPPGGGTARRFAAALAIGAAAVGVRWLLDPVLAPYQLFLAPGVAAPLVTFLHGAGPGWLTLVVATAASVVLFVAPQLDPGEPIAAPVLAGLLNTAAAIGGILVIAALQRSRTHAQRQAEAAVSAEERARRRDTYLREFMDHTSALMYVKDLEGRYVLVNNRFGEIFPEMKDRWHGTRSDAWLPPETVRKRVAIDDAVIDSGKSETYEETVPLADGRHTWVSVKFPIVDDAGRTIGVGGVSTDVTELHNARADLERKEQVLRNLIEIQEQEKQLLCSEFHDGLIQYAVGAKMLLESLRRAGLGPPELGALDDAILALARGIEDGRRVIRGIRPVELDDLGLAAALGALVHDAEAAGMTVDATIDSDGAELPASLHVTVYRIVQEAFSNIRRHSQARHARLLFARRDDEIVVEVGDDGVGLAADHASRKGFGITGMQERARLLGGECRVTGGPGAGTTVRVRLPIPGAASEAAQDRPDVAAG